MIVARKVARDPGIKHRAEHRARAREERGDGGKGARIQQRKL